MFNNREIHRQKNQGLERVGGGGGGGGLDPAFLLLFYENPVSRHF